MTARAPMFRILLKHWRSSRGMSQLDLAGAAGVSSRHLSFMETGRAQPSQEMALKLAAALGLDLRDQNELLVAAGFEPIYPASGGDKGFDAAIESALKRMMQQQEPYPLVVMNRRYDVLRTNVAAAKLLSRFVATADALKPPLNLIQGIFDPAKLRPYIQDWENLARHILTRAQREALGRPDDDELRALLHTVSRFPDVPADWHVPDLSLPMIPVLPVTLRRDGLQLSFLTTLTVFNAPQDVGLEELRIESYFPLDEATEAHCAEWAGA